MKRIIGALAKGRFSWQKQLLTTESYLRKIASLNICVTMHWRMKSFLLCSFLAVSLAVTESPVESMPSQNETDYHMTIDELEEEEEITIIDNNGTVVSVIDVFEKEGFQIEKPVVDEENVCFLRQLDEEPENEDEERCYKRTQLTTDKVIEQNMTTIVEHCEGRKMYLLEAHDCNMMYDESSNAVPASGLIRKKRSTWYHNSYCCYYKTYISSYCCIRKYYCCGWWCRSTCSRCGKYCYKIITELICIAN